MRPCPLPVQSSLLSFLSALRLSRCRSVVIFLVRRRHPCDCQAGRPALVSARGTVPVASPGPASRGAGSLGRTRSSWVRELAASLAQIFAQVLLAGASG